MDKETPNGHLSQKLETRGLLEGFREWIFLNYDLNGECVSERRKENETDIVLNYRTLISGRLKKGLSMKNIQNIYVRVQIKIR